MLTNISTWPTSLLLNHEDETTEFVAVKPLRHLPGKRITCSGYWQGIPVVAKLYLDPSNCQRHWLREKNGVEMLQSANITAPKLLFAGYLTDQTPVLLFELLPAAETALECWEELTTDEQRNLFLKQLLLVLSTHHLAGVVQTDLHLNNFICSNEIWYTIDADTIKSAENKKPLSLGDCIKNIALFYAQLPPQFDHLIEPSLSEYAHRRKLEVSTLHKQLILLLKEVRKQRRHKFIKKSYRTCSEFIRQNTKNQIAIYRRDVDSDRIKELLSNPDALITAGELLKDGNSATVVKIHHPQGDWVIKRYNIKNFWHGLRRCLRPSRAWVSWGNAHRLTISGIATPKAIAVIEKRLGSLRWGAYYVCEHIEGSDADKYYKSISSDFIDDKTKDHFVKLFNLMQLAGIVHGDCKATNFLIANKLPYVIDLDSMQEPKNGRKGQQNDKNRFLRNWDKQPEIKKWFEQYLP